MWPDGANSHWKQSVPGGNARPRSHSPGPAKYIFSVLNSITALFFRSALSPRSPGRSLFATAGVVTVPVETVWLSACLNEMGSVQSYGAACEP